MTADYIVLYVGAEELKDAKPCPFCNSKRLILRERNDNGIMREWVECASCEAMGPDGRRTRDHSLAISRWNQRGGQ